MTLFASFALVISAKIGNLGSLRSLGSLGRALSSFIRKAQPLPKFTILPNFTIFSLCFAPAPITKHHDLIFCQKGAECYTRQKSRRWAVLEVLLIVGIFC